MALNGQAYAIDRDRMLAAFGSKDAQLLDEILGMQVELVESYDDQLEVEDAEPSHPVRQALADIIEGVVGPGIGIFYGYAIEVLCDHFGQVIPVPDDSGCDEIGDPEDLEIESKLLSGDLPIPVPAWGDTPYVRFLTAEQVPEELERLSGEDLSHDDPSIEEGRQILLSQLKWASDRGRAFVTVVNG